MSEVGAMIPEIPNIEVLRQLIEAIEPQDGHAPLLAALAERYPALSWRVGDYAEEWYAEDKRVFAADGSLVADDRKVWLQDLVAKAGGSVASVWEASRRRGLSILAEDGCTVFAAAPIGPKAEDLLEMKIDRIVGSHSKGVFGDVRPQDIRDLLDPSCRERVDWAPPVRPRYLLRRMDGIARILAEAEELDRGRRRTAGARTILVSEIVLGRSDLDTGPTETTLAELNPDYLEGAIRERRFFDDWSSSSAAAWAIRTHWAFDVSDYEYRGERHLGLTPRPLKWGSKIEWEEGRSIHRLMELLERFDAEVGSQMGWFFHAVYGNRIGHWAIEAVAEGLARRRIALPEKDEAVVRRWSASASIRQNVSRSGEAEPSETSRVSSGRMTARRPVLAHRP